MRSGKLRHRLEYQEPTAERNSTGELKTGYDTKFSVWCKLEPLDGSEEVMPYTKAKVTHTITTRFQCGIDPKGILLYGNRKFRIASVINVDEMGREMVIMATEYNGGS